jgi:hypothetical protein
MTKHIDGAETQFYMPPIFNVITIKELKMDAAKKT